jgi:hypothetical protein
MNIISSYNSDLYHIGEHDGAGFRLNCGRTILDHNINVQHFPIYNVKFCTRCGTSADFEKINEQLAKYLRERKQKHIEQMAAQATRLDLRNEQRRQLTSEIMTALEAIGAIVEIEYFVAGAELTGKFKIDGQTHKFEMRLKR